MGKKKALIITDGTEAVQSIANSISGALEDFKIKICAAEKFTGESLLSADIFFIGCEKPNPASFSYLEDMLSHINLASRKCGVFSTGEKSIKYLGSLVKDCEAEVSKPLLAKEKIKKSDVKKWLKGLI